MIVYIPNALIDSFKNLLGHLLPHKRVHEPDLRASFNFCSKMSSTTACHRGAVGFALFCCPAPARTQPH